MIPGVADFSMTFLGTGTSVGVPVIGCDCAVCTSEDKRNRRFRSSVVVRAGGKTLLVDSGPDLRMQSLREGLREIDAVIYTHAHLDHVAGFDELRAFCWRKREPLPLHATVGCMTTLKEMYGWAFSPEKVIEGYVRPDARVIDGPFYYGDLKITPLPVEHAAVETIGFRFDFPGARSLAYISDVKRIPAETMELIAGVEVLVIDALRIHALLHHRADKYRRDAITRGVVVFVPRYDQQAVVRVCPAHVGIKVGAQPLVAADDGGRLAAVMHVVFLVRHNEGNRRQFCEVRREIRERHVGRRRHVDALPVHQRIVLALVV